MAVNMGSYWKSVLGAAAAAVLLAASPVLAQEQVVIPTEELVEPQPIGQLAVQIVVSDSPDFFNSWRNRSNPNEVPPVNIVNKASAGQRLVAAFLATGLTADKEGKYNFTVDWRLIKPDGSMAVEQMAYAKGDGVLPEAPAFFLAEPALWLMFEKSDKRGVYHLQAAVEDKTTGKRAEADYPIHYPE